MKDQTEGLVECVIDEAVIAFLNGKELKEVKIWHDAVDWNLSASVGEHGTYVNIRTWRSCALKSLGFTFWKRRDPMTHTFEAIVDEPDDRANRIGAEIEVYLSDEWFGKRVKVTVEEINDNP